MSIVTFGEIMLRLSTPSYKRFVQSDSFDATYGGAEANVAVALSNYGLNSTFITKLPDNEIGQSAINILRSFGVDTSLIIRGGQRIGINFMEIGASQRPSKVIYDRKHSAIAGIETNQIDWESIFKDKQWFHWTGITPSLSENTKKVLQEALICAKRNNLTVSCDLNFREKLWSEKEAQSVMVPLMEYVDVCVANEEDAEKSLGEVISKTNIGKPEINEESYFLLAAHLKEKYKFSSIAITLRESYSASRNGWSAILLDDKECLTPQRSTIYDVQIVDRVGGGDSFTSALIYGLLKMNNTKETLEFAVAASCLKQTIPGDFNLVTKEEVLKLVNTGGSGRVER